MISIINSRYGPTPKQIESFSKLIKEFPRGEVFQHGMSDADLNLHNQLVLGGFDVRGYPSNTDDNSDGFDKITPSPSQPLGRRNQHLVDTADTIIALPQYMNEWEDSPQWKTIRYAKSRGIVIYVISPAAGYIYRMV